MSFDTLRRKEFIVGQSSIEDAQRAIERYRYSEDDFTVSVDDDTQWDTGLTPIQGSVHFKYNPTGIERHYKIGMGSTWAAEFELDLQSAVFTG